MPTIFEVTHDQRTDYRPALRRTDDGCSIPAGTVYQMFKVVMFVPAAAAADGVEKVVETYVFAPDAEQAKAQSICWDRENPVLTPAASSAIHTPSKLEEETGVKIIASRVPFRVRGWGHDKF